MVTSHQSSIATSTCSPCPRRAGAARSAGRSRRGRRRCRPPILRPFPLRPAAGLRGGPAAVRSRGPGWVTPSRNLAHGPVENRRRDVTTTSEGWAHRTAPTVGASSSIKISADSIRSSSDATDRLPCRFEVVEQGDRAPPAQGAPPSARPSRRRARDGQHPWRRTRTVPAMPDVRSSIPGLGERLHQESGILRAEVTSGPPRRPSNHAGA